MLREQLRAGSSKEIFATDKPGQLALRFTDKVSVFDRGSMSWNFTGLGRTKCQISALLFGRLERCGIPTHYRGGVSGDFTTVLVDACRIDELDFYPEHSRGRILPIECLWRNQLSEGAIGRLRAGTLLTDMSRPYFGGSPEDAQAGMWLGRPFPDFSTKFEPVDRYLTYEDAMELAGLNDWQFIQLLNFVVKASSLLKRWFGQAGFDSLDGKFEIAIDDHGNFFLVDGISPDELGLRGKNDGHSYDKNPLRRFFEEYYPDWVAELKQLKKLCPDRPDLWSPYPDVPRGQQRLMVQAMTGRYRTVLERLRELPSLEA